jgi:hypothetical protein
MTNRRVMTGTYLMNGTIVLLAAACFAGGIACQSAQAQTKGDAGQAPAPKPGATAEGQMAQATQTGDAGVAPKTGSGTSDVPNSTCRPGYLQQGNWLCMTGARGPASLANAFLDCMDSGARVANYHDWRYRIFRGDGVPGPVGWWLGPITADNTALFVNSTNVGDFDGETSRFDSRNYACAHDLIR